MTGVIERSERVERYVGFPGRTLLDVAGRSGEVMRVSVDTALIGAAAIAVIGAVAYGLTDALVEVSLREYVSRRWPRFAGWWRSVGGSYVRFLLLFAFFGSSALGFGLVAAGVVVSEDPEPVLLVIVVPAALMTLWALLHLAAVRATGNTWRGYRRSSDGTWSAG